MSITTSQAAGMQFTPASGAAQGTASFTYTVLENLGGRSQTAATYSILMAVADAQTSPILSNSAGQKAIPTLTATSGTASPTNYRILTLPSTGTLYVNGTAATTNLLITAAQAAQLTFAATTGYFGTTSFTYAPADASGDVGDAATYAIPVTTASCGTTNSILDFSRRTIGEDWTNHASVAVNASNITSGNYSSVGASGGNSFIVDNNTALPGPSLAWRQVNTGNDPGINGSGNTATVTFTFDQPVRNLSLSIQDIDQTISATQAFTDALTLDGYSTAASTTPIALVAGNFALGNTNTFSGSNTVTGTGNSSVDPAGNIVVTFPSPVQRLTLTFKNIAPYTSATINRTHTMGITSMTWCRLAPVANNVTTATLPNTAGPVGISSLSSTVDGTVATYTLVTIPNATTQGTLAYNSGGTTYTAVTAGQTLTVAQAASLRFTPVSTASGNYTFTYTVQDTNGQTSANTATYTIPVVNTPCATATGTFAFSSRTAGEDWKTRTATPVPAGSTATTVSTSNYNAPASATVNTFAIGTVNSTQTLQWSTDYATQAANTSTVTFNFNRAVSNFVVRVQDIDTGTGFLDQVVFTGTNSGTPVTPVLGPLPGSANTVAINGNTATGTATNSSTTNATILAYFPSPVTTLTLTYSNISTTQADPSNNIIGIDLLQFCRLAPVANDVTTATLLSSVGTASIASLASTVDGTATSYTLTSIPNATTQGVLSYNSSGTTYTNITSATQVLTPAQAASLRFTPVAGSNGNVTFGYKVTDDAGLVSANTATYTIPVSNATCATATATVNFATQTVGDDWKAHAALGVPTGSTMTTLGSSGYTTPASATTSTLTVTSASATTNINGVQTLAWITDYASQAANTSTVTFNFNRAVSNFSMRVQDIDKSETTDGNGNVTSAFNDRVTFVGANGATTVLPSLAAVGSNNTVLINGNVATGTTNITNTTDGTVIAYFATPITSITLTYSNISTYAADPTANGIGIDLLNFCRLNPVATDVTNTSRPSGQGAAPINSLNATADGTIASYTISAVPAASQGTYYVNGVVLNATNFPGLVLTPTQATQLTFAPAATFSGTSSFTYFATDDAGLVTNVANYSVPVTATGGSGTPAPCANPGKDGSVTGLAGTVNTYFAGTASVAAKSTATTIPVAASVGANTGITAGDLLLVIQMQGADINSSNTNNYGANAGNGGGNLSNTNFTAGTYEYVVATTNLAANTAGSIGVAALVNSYATAPATATSPRKSFQVVRIPQYASITLGGQLNALPWNGSAGGILAIDVAGTLNLNGQTLNAAAAGFRGGAAFKYTGAAGTASTDYRTSSALAANGTKGEGTAGTPRYTLLSLTAATRTDNTTNTAAFTSGVVDGYPNGDNGKGAPGNAGGGGTDEVPTGNSINDGGAGGANGGAGGLGGWPRINVTVDMANQAIGGVSFAPVSSSRLVMGGGGGAGTSNDGNGDTGRTGIYSSGVPGGGLILVRTGSVSGNGTANASGDGGYTLVGNLNNSGNNNDGGGGGGAGGTVLITANNTAGLANLMVLATGGKGTSNSNSGDVAHGPGGGGGGGVILANGALNSASSAVGGAAGTIISSDTYSGTTYGATPGAAGVVNTQISTSIANSTAGNNCSADVTTALTGPATLTPGQPSGTYTATFANEGPSTAQTVTRKVTLPAGATNIFVNGVAYTPTTANTIDFGTLTSLASGASNSFTFSFTPAATATATGTLAITSNVTTATSQGTDAAPNASTITATVAPVADVAATISAGTTVPAGTLASAGTPPSFTVNFTNNGPATAAGVVAQVQLPTGLTNVTATNGGVYNATTGIVSYAGLTSINNGVPTSSVIKFDAPATGPVMATASISTTTSQAGQTANDRQTAALPLTAAFDLTTSISGPASSVAGDLVTLAITTTNSSSSSSPSAAANVVQTAQLATGLTNVFVSNGGFYNATASSTTVTYGGVSYTVPAGGVIYPPLASLPSGQTVANTVSFTMPAAGFAPSATVTPNTTAGSETNTANNTAYLNTPASGTATPVTLATATATGNPANVYTKISSSTAVTAVGSNVTLTVTTGNNGSASSAGGLASGVVQTVQVLPGFTAGTTGTIQVDGQTGTLSGNTITFATSGATYNTLTGMVTFPGITQASGASVNHTITFAAPASTGNNGQLLATAMVTTTNVDPVPADNTAATVIDLAPTTDLAATLTGPATATAGQVISYTATFTNNGGMAASGYNVSGTQTAGVFETAQLPVGLSAVTITNASGATVTGASYDPTTGAVTFPALTTDAVGATQVYTLSFVAPAQSLVANATVNTASPDGNPANNSASVTTTITPAADLTTTVSAPATAAAGNPVNYTLTTTNNGPSAATTVVPTLQLAAGYTTSNIFLAGQTGTLNSTTGIITFTNGTYNTNTGLVTLNTTASLASGASLLNRVTVIMPSAPAGGQLSAVSSVTSATTDVNPGNNNSSVATSVAPATPTTADLVATVSATPTSVNPGDALTLTATFTSNGPDAATNVVPTMQLPAGLTVGTISNGGVYNTTTGLVTWPTVSSLASGTANALVYTVSLTAPAVSPLIAVAGVSSDTSEPNNSTALNNNTARLSIVVNPVFDEVTRLGGPTLALAGTSQTYTVTTLNNGPSATANATTQTISLPGGITPTNITNGGVYSNNTITWTIPAGQAAGAAGAVGNSFTVTQPAGGLTLTANVTVTGESNTANNSATLTTAVPNQQPTAAAVINSLQSPEGNTAASSTNAPYGMLISPLVGSDPEGALNTTTPYTIVTIPATTQGTLYYTTGGTTYTAVTAGQTLTAAQAGTLRFLPAAGYIGNANFTYLATDAANNQSAPANYTIPVGSDATATYATYNGTKGGTNKYVNGDVLAQAVDPNASRYNAAGNIYDTQGNQLATTANGIGNAVITSGTLPAGVSIDPATGRIYVSDISTLVNNSTARNYTVTVTTTDANGGVSVVPVTFTIGAYPLPVVLTDFTAQAVLNRDALLTWATASEKNNDHFDIERSFDGTSFTKIGQVAGHGTTSVASAYTLTDANVAAKATGTVYYRLRQVDLDGTATYSPVRSVRFTASAAAAPIALSLYPNPAQASTTLDLSQLPATGTYQVVLLDATGRTVRATTLGGGLTQPLNISDLATGTYNVLVTGQLADGSALRQVLRLIKE